MKVEVDVLGSPSLIILMVSVDVKRGGRPRLPVRNNPYGLCGHKATLNLKRYTQELGSCVKVEVDVLGSLIILTVSADVKQP